MLNLTYSISFKSLLVYLVKYLIFDSFLESFVQFSQITSYAWLNDLFSFMGACLWNI